MLARLVTDGGMPNLDQPAMRAAFAAGKTGIHVTSTSDLNKVTQMIGDKFVLKTHTFPTSCAQRADCRPAAMSVMILGQGSRPSAMRPGKS